MLAAAGVEENDNHAKQSLPNPSPHTALTAAQTPAASVQPSPFLPSLRVQIPTAFSLAATISQHQPPSTSPPSTSISGQPRSHQSTKAQPSSCTQPSSAAQPLLPHKSAAQLLLLQRTSPAPDAVKAQPSSASQPLLLLHPAPAAPSSYPALAAQPSPPAKALPTQLLSKGPAQSSVTVMADSLKEVAPAHTVPVLSPLYIGGKRKTRWILGKEPKPVESDPKFDEWVSDNYIILGWMFNSMEDRVYHMFMYHDTVHGLSVADYFGYLQTRWEELAQYEPLSDFPSDGAILNTSPLPSLYEAFAIVDGDERRRRLLPSLSESPIIVPDQRAFAASSGTHLYCQHCPSCGGRGGGRGRGTPWTGAIAEVESIPTDLPDFKQLQLQIAQLQSHLGLAPTFPSSGPTAAIVAETPTALHGPDFEIFAVDNPIPPRPLPILEPSPPTPTDSLPPIDSQNPSPCAHAPLSASSLESGMSSSLVSDPPPRYPTRGKVPLVSYSGMHQLHIFIFVLPVIHILYSFQWKLSIIMALSQTKRDITLPKIEGGLGIRNSKAWNKNLLSKTMWDIQAKKDTLWVHWVHQIYMKHANFWEYQIKHDDFPLIKQVIALREEIIATGRSQQAATHQINQWMANGELNSKLAYEYFRPKAIKVVAITVFFLLSVAFYAFFAPFLGKDIYEYVAIGVYSFLAIAVFLLYVRCTAIDPADPGILVEADKTSAYRSYNDTDLPGLFCCFLNWEDCRKDEHILRQQSGEDGFFCTLCHAEVRKFSKHCRSCDKCVDGFDHHCRLVFECGVGISVLVRCFVDQKAMAHQITEQLGEGFSRAPFATVVVLCTVVSFLAIVPLGELLFFHLILIQKGITTYEYVVAMRAQSEPPGPSVDGGDLPSFPSSPTSSADEIIPHLEPGRLPSTMDPDAPEKGKVPQRPVRISAWKLAKLDSNEAMKEGAKARASSSVLRPVSARHHTYDGDHLSSSSMSGRSSPTSTHQGFHNRNAKGGTSWVSPSKSLYPPSLASREDIETCAQSYSNLGSPHPTKNLSLSPLDQQPSSRDHFNLIFQSSADQSPCSVKASDGNETAESENLSQLPVRKNNLSAIESSRSSIFWDQEAGRFVSAATRSVGSAQVSGTELSWTGQSMLIGGPLMNEQVNRGQRNSSSVLAAPERGPTSSYYQQQGRLQRGGPLPVFVPSDSQQQNQFSSRLH
ncbi:DHHC-type zinc finger family protein [Actinidia rufa]|uniref:DHHC-type zinc finger family protein n=1 Tax=Actinidia rufa TaxID=165716 RepID=A0A7J0DM34_9ERIC|nr:DHHC-type zinc finger family protein [Actinidia rufa]